MQNPHGNQVSAVFPAVDRKPYTQHKPYHDGNQQSADILGFLRHTDTCSVSNAIETLHIRMCNEGFVQGDTRCLFPDLPPVAGYAVTATIRSAAPPIAGRCYYQRPD